MKPLEALVAHQDACWQDERPRPMEALEALQTLLHEVVEALVGRHDAHDLMHGHLRALASKMLWLAARA